MTPAIATLMEQAQLLAGQATAVLREAPMPLEPHTARLCNQTIRLSKGILTAVQEWVADESRARRPVDVRQ